MSVRTKLIAIGLLLAVLPLVTGLILLATSRHVRVARQKATLAEELEHEVFNLTLLTNEFSRYRSARAKRQLGEQQSQIQQLAGRIEVVANDRDERRIVETIGKATRRLEALTSELVASDSAETPSESDERWQNRLTGQLLIAAQAVLSNSRRLRARWTGELGAAQATADWWVFGTILLTVLLGGGTLVVLYRGIAPPLQRLAGAVADFGGGKRDVRVESDSRDEIGFVCRAFNEMAGELQQHHEHLEELVAQRTAELVHANEALELSNMELQQFAYIASHDLQTPLRAIAGFSHFLQKEYHGQIDDNADEYIERIVEGVKRMQQLINDLLAYARVESRAVPFEPTRLNEVFDDAVALLRTSIEDAGAEVTRDEMPTVRGDRAHLSQLLQNLIANGIKYHGDQPPRLRVSADRDTNKWTIAVRDNGIGIAPEYHEKIFEIFRRLHTQQVYPGTGIGLAVCRRIVNRHGGRIWVESEEGEGSTFYFTIPDQAGETL